MDAYALVCPDTGAQVDVTVKPKCYVYVCAGCGLLAVAERSDCLTCSPKCRVRAHRNGSLARLKVLAAGMHIPPALIVRAEAVRRLRPDLVDRVLAGELTLDDTRREIWAAYMALLVRETA